MAVTIKEIASLANVSRGTVDKVLNNRPGVKESTKKKILKIAEELNYQPNIIGKALVRSKDPIRIGIILTPDYNPYIQELLHGIQTAQKEFAPFGLEVIAKLMTTLEPQEQLTIIDELVNSSVQGMAIFPTNAPQVIDRVNQLIQGQMAVITFNSKVDGIRHLAFIGQNHYKGGRTAASLLGKIVPSPVRAGVIISSSNLSCHHDRLSGFQDKLSEAYTDALILDVQENQDRKEDAFRITLEYCNRYPDLNAIYLTSGGIAGVCSALDVAEKRGIIKVICHDLPPETLNLLNSGQIDFALGQNPEQQGYQLVKVLFEYLIKNITPNNEIEIPITIAIDELAYQSRFL